MVEKNPSQPWLGPEVLPKQWGLTRLRLDFVRCVDCGHVFNAAFEYARVPYSAKPNLMFNRAAKWSLFVQQKRQELFGPPGPMSYRH